MIDPGLPALAAAVGLSPAWIDYRGQTRQVESDVLLQILEAMTIAATTATQRHESLQKIQDEARQQRPPLMTALTGHPIHLPPHLPQRHDGWFRIDLENGGRIEGRCRAGEPLPAIDKPGYHQLAIDQGEPLILAVAPPRCFAIGDLEVAPHRRWGLTAQVYSLRRAGDGGIGDLGGVSMLARRAASLGADAIAISPVHALFAAWPERHAPYAPSSRLMRNPLLADPGAVFDAAQVAAATRAAGAPEEMLALERLPMMDAAHAAPLKYARMAALHAELDRQPKLRTAFEKYCVEAGAPLREHACFEVLHAHFLRSGGKGHWRNWPSDYRDPRDPSVQRFANEHRHDVEFQMFAQWLADRSLAQTQLHAREAGMDIGLIGDLAVGTDSGGSHAWSRQADMLTALRIGAPPDLLNTAGQDWGLTTFSPQALQGHGYAAFIELLRASLRHVGGIRLDHVFGLQRLWLIPPGAGARQGAYLQYPVEDLLRLVMLESWRHRAIVIGEDLGTVPQGFEHHLKSAGVCGLRVMWFQQTEGSFIAPEQWPASAVALTTTHDLPTVAGWWCGRDLGWRSALDLLEPGDEGLDPHAVREAERVALWNAFTTAGVAAGPMPDAEQGGVVADAAAAFIGHTAAALALLPVEDALALVEQPNIPGTTDQHPNWCCRLTAEVDAAFADPEVHARLAMLDAARKAAP